MKALFLGNVAADTANGVRSYRRVAPLRLSPIRSSSGNHERPRPLPTSSSRTIGVQSGPPHGEILGAMVGIVGLGRVGQEVARRAAAFGGRVGIWRLIELFDSHRVTATIFMPGRACEPYPQALCAAVRSGHEIADHMWEHRVPKEATRFAGPTTHAAASALLSTLVSRPGPRAFARRI